MSAYLLVIHPCIELCADLLIVRCQSSLAVGCCPAEGGVSRTQMPTAVHSHYRWKHRGRKKMEVVELSPSFCFSQGPIQKKKTKNKNKNIKLLEAQLIWLKSSSVGANSLAPSILWAKSITNLGYSPLRFLRTGPRGWCHRTGHVVG